MLSPQPQLMNELHFSIRGDVTVHPSAAIAPGVLLQADLGARLVIAAGASIGAGSILHAHTGVMTIDANACLGSGVLLVGSGKIGANACVGSMTTILNGCVEAGQVIPPKTLIGDRSRQIVLSESESSVEVLNLNGSKPSRAVIEPEAIESEVTESEAIQPKSSDSAASEPEAKPIEAFESEETQSKETQSEVGRSQSAQPDIVEKPKVYGLDAFNGLMASLSPYRQTLNQPLNQVTSASNQAPE